MKKWLFLVLMITCTVIWAFDPVGTGDEVKKDTGAGEKKEGEDEDKISAKKIDAIIDRLDNNDELEREKAYKELRAIGEQASVHLSHPFHRDQGQTQVAYFHQHPVQGSLVHK